MQVKREQACSEVYASEPARGNSYVHISNNIIDIDPSSPSHTNLDVISLNRIYTNLDKDLATHQQPKPRKSLMILMILNNHP